MKDPDDSMKELYERYSTAGAHTRRQMLTTVLVVLSFFLGILSLVMLITAH